MEYYRKKDGVSIICHQLRHTMVVQQINAGADVATIQELLGHSKIQMTMQYSRLSNMRAKCDYYEAMEKILLGEYVKQ